MLLYYTLLNQFNGILRVNGILKGENMLLKHHDKQKHSTQINNPNFLIKDEISWYMTGNHLLAWYNKVP